MTELNAPSETNKPTDASRLWYDLHASIPTRCRVPARYIASISFQQDPIDLEIEWVRQEHAGFFETLSRIPSPAERATIFHNYALFRFWANEPMEKRPHIKEQARRGYISLLRGWGYDSNSHSGAVLKGWAERCFGLRPIWHGHLLKEPDQDELYYSERLRGHLYGIGMQLDLLYCYCQDELKQRHPDQQHLTLYRGCYDPEQHIITRDDQSEIVEFNAVSSFSDNREVAWEFGSTVWSVKVPLSKILLAPGILPPQLLQGEREYLVLGGHYRVKQLLY
ncbi:NAD(+)--dinitrogen-reductase ADP-D-ribosyltransferase [Kiritimatiellota bacterium B12222]|nr:NAD(+)--dinitrogen-reductase ADP-D-ribosyltransferase [Kiritimatiellota bacterium B12222]